MFKITRILKFTSFDRLDGKTISKSKGEKPTRGASLLKSKSKSKNVRKPSIRRYAYFFDFDFDFDFEKVAPRAGFSTVQSQNRVSIILFTFTLLAH